MFKIGVLKIFILFINLISLPNKKDTKMYKNIFLIFFSDFTTPTTLKITMALVCIVGSALKITGVENSLNNDT